jgi:hypothetical protein
MSPSAPYLRAHQAVVYKHHTGPPIERTGLGIAA